MPSKTPKQHRAMMAAAHGHSTLGIPQKVGQDFVAADASKPAALSKGGRLVDHGDHFKLHTQGGDVFTIAHKGLHPSTVKHLRKFAEGGTVKYMDEGGDDRTPGDGVTAPDAYVREEQDAADEGLRGEGGGDEQPGEDRGGMAAVTQVMREGNAARDADERASSTGPLYAGAGMTEPEVGTVGPLKGGIISKEAPTGGSLGTGEQPPAAEQPGTTSDNVQLGKFVAAKVHDITPQEVAANEAAKAARSENAAKQAEAAGDTEKANAEKIQGLQALQKSSDEHFAEIQGRARQLRQDIENGKIDPSHYWADRGTGGRITASIGLLLSGLGSGLGGGPNMAMQVIQKNIDRDIDAQKANLETKKSLLADTYRETGDLRLATQMAQHTLMNVALAKLNTIAAKSSSAAVKANAAVANAAGDMALAQSARGIADRRSANQAAAANANTQAQNSLALQKAKAGDALKTPREMQGSKIGNLNATISDLDEHLGNLEKGSQGVLGAFKQNIRKELPWGKDEKASAAAAGVLREKVASALGGGVASDQRIKQALDLVPEPADNADLAKDKIARLKQLLATQRDEYARQQAQVGYRVGSTVPMQPTPAAPSLKR